MVLSRCDHKKLPVLGISLVFNFSVTAQPPNKPEILTPVKLLPLRSLKAMLPEFRQKRLDGKSIT